MEVLLYYFKKYNGKTKQKSKQNNTNKKKNKVLINNLKQMSLSLKHFFYQHAFSVSPFVQPISLEF